MLGKLKDAAMLVLDPPWTQDGPETFTLAVPESHSTFKRGAVGWENRPPARVRCPTCSTEFVHKRANDIISCPVCSFEHAPEDFADMELLELNCPECQCTLDHGIRHPEVLDVPEWASCTRCQYHWEFQHDY